MSRTVRRRTASHPGRAKPPAPPAGCWRPAARPRRPVPPDTPRRTPSPHSYRLIARALADHHQLPQPDQPGAVGVHTAAGGRARRTHRLARASGVGPVVPRCPQAERAGPRPRPAVPSCACGPRPGRCTPCPKSSTVSPRPQGRQVLPGAGGSVCCMAFSSFRSLNRPRRGSCHIPGICQALCASAWSFSQVQGLPP